MQKKIGPRSKCFEELKYFIEDFNEKLITEIYSNGKLNGTIEDSYIVYNDIKFRLGGIFNKKCEGKFTMKTFPDNCYFSIDTNCEKLEGDARFIE